MKKTKKHLWVLFVVITIVYILGAMPYVIRAYNIQEIYLSPDSRSVALEALFYAREVKGVAVSDMFLYDIKKQGETHTIKIVWEYHGRLKQPQIHDDLKMEYVIQARDGEYSLMSERKL